MLNTILKPITLVINQLSYSWKFIMLSLLFIGVLATPIYELNNYVNGSIGFSEKEQVGMQYIDPLKRFLFSLNSYQNARLANSGNLPSPTILDPEWDAVEKAEAKNGEILATAKPFASLKKSYLEFKEKATRLHQPISTSCKYPASKRLYISG